MVVGTTLLGNALQSHRLHSSPNGSHTTLSPWPRIMAPVGSNFRQKSSSCDGGHLRSRLTEHSREGINAIGCVGGFAEPPSISMTQTYVVIELKVVDFKPEFAGKLNFYVAACNKLLRQPEDNPTIGLLLCKSKDQTKVEWAFDSIQNPMGVATYEGIKIKDKLPSVEDLKKRLDMVEQELREYKENEEASNKEDTDDSNQKTE